MGMKYNKARLKKACAKVLQLLGLPSEWVEEVYKKATEYLEKTKKPYYGLDLYALAGALDVAEEKKVLITPRDIANISDRLHVLLPSALMGKSRIFRVLNMLINIRRKSLFTLRGEDLLEFTCDYFDLDEEVRERAKKILSEIREILGNRVRKPSATVAVAVYLASRAVLKPYTKPPTLAEISVLLDVSEVSIRRAIRLLRKEKYPPALGVIRRGGFH